MPQRIQLRRTKGWRMPPDTVKVDRTTRWGNQFKVDPVKSGVGYEVYKCTDGRWGGPTSGYYPTKAAALAAAVRHHREWLTGPQGDLMRVQARESLRGLNIACWCQIGAPCHGDTWLEVANG